MILNILSWLLLVAAVVFFIWLATRAWKARRWFVRWPGLVLSALLGLVFALLSVIGAIGLVKVYTPAGQPPQALQVNATQTMIQRGQHIAAVFCADCHMPAGQTTLVGGQDLSKDIPIPIGSLVSNNLTPGGPLKDWSDGEILRTLREGVDPNGRKLLIMGSTNIRFMSDEDLQAVIAYLRSLPAVDHSTQTPNDQMNLLGVLIAGAGLIPELPPVTSPITAPPKAATVEYGKYILSYQDCRGCHGADLNGGTSKVSPNGPPLRVVKSWTLAQFINTMRSGIAPGGYELKPPMPAKTIGLMDDDELGAMYKYLTSLW
jgi:mono/diheme cytochrome c family protein